MENIPIKVLIYEAIRAVACIGICAMGLGSMYVTQGDTGIGWAILGIAVIYFPTIIFPEVIYDDEGDEDEDEDGS